MNAVFLMQVAVCCCPTSNCALRKDFMDEHGLQWINGLFRIKRLRHKNIDYDAASSYICICVSGRSQLPSSEEKWKRILGKSLCAICRT